MKMNFLAALLIISCSQFAMAADCQEGFAPAWKCQGEGLGPIDANGFNSKISAYAVVCVDREYNYRLGLIATGMARTTLLFFDKTVKDGLVWTGYANNDTEKVSSVLTMTGRHASTLEITGVSAAPMQMFCK